MAAAFLGTASMASDRVSWPDLPTKGFIKERLATVEDVDRGDAVFSTNGAGHVVSVVIPQYAYWRDEKGAKHPRILVQAEGAPNGLTMVGLRDFAGNESVATLPEVELLGTRKPQ
ncbi:hypothetical protein EAH87_17360 [Sphingomonas koreensis]|nr:hypothetical protein EAH87_17360 [Sphingomonas koreensis]